MVRVVFGDFFFVLGSGTRIEFSRAIVPNEKTKAAPFIRMRFQKFAFSFHWKRNESIASTRSFSDRFARPHGNDEND